MASRKQTDQIYSVILDRICLLDYPPHTMLRESELAKEFSISRTPIRDVFLRLSLMGLVESRNGVGTFVTGMDYSAYRDIYEMRLKVAELIGDLSPNDACTDDVEAVADLRSRAAALQSEFDLRIYWNLNHELHFVVGRLIGNSALAELWDRFYYQTARIWYSIAERDARETAEAFLGELDATLRAMRENDVKAVGYVQRNYIAAGMRKVLSEIDPETGEYRRGPAVPGAMH